jgi:spectinomycin phosphotransferase
MLVANTSIDPASLAALVAREYGGTTQPVFVPGAGGDSWCYRAGDWWVSVRRDRLGHVAAAYDAARELCDHGFEFVLAPARGRGGRVVHDVDGRPVVVFPYVQGTSLHPGPASRADAAAIGRMVERLHAGSVAVELPVETFEVVFADELTEGIEVARRGAADAGPYGSTVSTLIRANEQRLDVWREEMASVIATCRSNPGEFVLTHGEPDGGNVMAAAGDGLLLMDWGALQWAPSERDARSLRELGLPTSARPAFLRYYELQWILSEVAEYVSRFVHPHAGDAEDEEKWAELLKYLARP